MLNAIEEVDATGSQNAVLEGLLNLPTRGLFSESFISHSSPKLYVATHDRALPPADQIIASEQSTEAFIRMLQRKNNSGEAGGTAGKKTAGAKRGLNDKVDEQPKKKLSLGLAAGLAQISGPKKSASLDGPSSTGAEGPHAAGPSSSKAAAGAAQKRPAAAAARPMSVKPGLFGAQGAAAPRAAAAALSAAVQQQGAEGPSGARRTFTQEELQSKPVKDLKVCACDMFRKQANKRAACFSEPA